MKEYYIVHKGKKRVVAYGLEFAKSIARDKYEIEKVIKEDKPRLSEKARAELRADLQGATVEDLARVCNSVKPRGWR